MCDLSCPTQEAWILFFVVEINHLYTFLNPNTLELRCLAGLSQNNDIKLCLDQQEQLLLFFQLEHTFSKLSYLWKIRNSMRARNNILIYIHGAYICCHWPFSFLLETWINLIIYQFCVWTELAKHCSIAHEKICVKCVSYKPDEYEFVVQNCSARKKG